MSMNCKNLDQLAHRQCGRICGFSSTDDAMVVKLREIGFAEGDEVEVLARGFVGGTPLSVRLNQTVIALRKRAARLVLVETGA